MVGRKNCEILLSNDQSISRVHANLAVTEQVSNSPHEHLCVRSPKKQRASSMKRWLVSHDDCFCTLSPCRSYTLSNEPQ